MHIDLYLVIICESTPISTCTDTLSEKNINGSLRFSFFPLFFHALIKLFIYSHGAECPAVCLQQCIRVTVFAHTAYGIA